MIKLYLVVLPIITLFGAQAADAQCTGAKGPNLLSDRGTFSAPFITVNTTAAACAIAASNSFNPVENVGNALGICDPLVSTPCSEYNYTAEMLGLVPDFTYTLIKNIGDNNGGNCIKPDWRGKDHTGDGGYFMAVNGAPANTTPPVFYQIKNIPVCSGATYELSAWVINLLSKTSGNAKPGTEPNISFKINGNVIVSSGPIAYNSNATWVKVVGSFTASTSLVDLQVITTAAVLIGNDFGVDDISINVCRPQPAFNAPVSLSICSGTGVTGNSIIGEIVKASTSYDWKISTDGGTSYNAADPSSISQTGIYQLVVSNSCGFMDTALFNISVLPKPSLGSDKIIAICDGNILDLTMQFNTSALNTIFTINEVFVNTPSAVNIPGAYQLIATNDSGCSDTAVVNLTVNSKPSLGADKKISICSGTAIDLTANFSTTGLNTTWTKGNVSVPNPRSITSSGIYILVATNDFTCADTAIVTLVDNQSPTVRVVNPEPVCAPSTVNLTLFAVTSGSTPGLSFSYWQDAAASVSVLNADKAVNGLYFIKGTDTNGCFNIKPVAAVVYALPIVSAGRDTVICNQTVAFLHGNAVSSQAGAIVYSWSPAPGLSTPGSATTIARPGTSTIYTLSATVNYGVCSLTASDVVQVRMQPPVPAFAGNDTTAIEGIPHQLQASGGVNYLWFPPGSLNNPAIANPLAKLSQDTKFTVRVTDFAGCAATDTIIITVYPNIRYNLPTAFSPNGDGLNDVFRPLPIGIISTEWFRIYNRYGNLMHEAVNSLQGWDGYLNGKIQEIGNYVWAIKGIGKDGRVIQMKGNVVLVR